MPAAAQSYRPEHAEVALASPRDAPRRRRSTLVAGRVLRTLAVILLLSGMAASMQWYVGAFEADFSAYPDAPCHYVSGLMVERFLRSGEYLHPLRFAENYYVHYPEIGIGHWPPLLYTVEAAWATMFGHARTAVLLLHSVIAGLLAFVLYRESSRIVGRAGILVAAGFLVLPAVVGCYSLVMADTLVALLMTASVLALARYFAGALPRDAYMWGVYAGLAILAKGTGWCLLVLPPIAAVLTARPALLKDKRLVPAALSALAICGPWQVATMRMVLNGWESGRPSPGYSVGALPSILNALNGAVGWGVLVLAVIGIVWTLWPAERDNPFRAWWSVVVAAVGAQIAFAAAVPVGIEFRKVLGLAPLLLLLAVAGADGISKSCRGRWVGGAAIVAVVLSSVLAIDPYDRLQRTSLARAAAAVVGTVPRGSAILVSSAKPGREGAAIAEIAMRAPDPAMFVVRATKLLARTDWLGQQYELTFSDRRGLQELLDQVPINFILLDRRTGPFRHNAELSGLLAANSGAWTVTKQFGSGEGGHEVILFTRNIPIPAAPKVRVDVQKSLGRILESF